nr:DNA polymerase III subunit delta [Zoogloeaceae bacterium]
MILRPEQLAPHLGQALAPLYVLHGNEPLLVLEAADAIRSAARHQGFDERETLVSGQGFRWDSVFMAAGNVSLFGSNKLIDLRIPSGKPGREGGEALQRYVKQVHAGTLTLITLPGLDWQTRKTAWFKALEEAGVAIELNAPPREHLPGWIAERLARQGQSAGADGLVFIADHVEGNLLAAHQEILKLALLHPEGALTLKAIQEAVLNVARYDLDMLREALLDADPARCVRILEGLRAEAAAPPLVLWTVANEIRTLASLRAGLDAGASLSDLFRTERIFDEQRKRKLQQRLPRLGRNALAAALLHAARVDRIVKGIASGDAWDELLRLGLRIARK